jgi:hypothetical protein
MKKPGIVICIPQSAIHNVVPPYQQRLPPSPIKYLSLNMYHHSTVITDKPLLARKEPAIKN